MSRRYDDEVTENVGLWDAELFRHRKHNRGRPVRARTGFATRDEALDWLASMRAELALKERERLAATERNARSKEDSNKRSAEALSKELEAMHPEVFVIEAVAHGGGAISMKIQTPIDVYLSTGTREEWIRTVRNDIAASGSFPCPMCGVHLERNCRACVSCGAVAAEDGKGLAQALHVESLDTTAALHALDNLDSCLREDTARHLLWGRLPPRPSDGYESAFAAITGPDIGPGTVELPFLVDVDNLMEGPVATVMAAESAETAFLSLDGNERACVSLPDCRFCVHSAEFVDDSQTIAGVSSMFRQEASLCVFPCIGSQLAKAHPLAFVLHAWQVRGYRTDETAVVRNALVGRAIHELSDVTDQDSDLEARVESPSESFHGPICRRFVLNEDHVELSSYPLEKTPFKVRVHFGIANLERERRLCKEEDRAARARSEAETEGIVDAMLADPACRAVLKTRIESRNFVSDETDRLVELIESRIPRRARADGHLSSLYRTLNLSNTVSIKFRRLIANRVGSSGNR